MTKNMTVKTATALATVAAARVWVQDRMRQQVDEAAESRTPTTTALPEDGRVKTAFLVLLPPPVQRDVFLLLISRSVSWPRVVHLVGRPPFSFLLPHDASGLRAGGFSATRINMAGDAANSQIPGYSAFGAQLQDQYGREYKVASSDGGGYFDQLAEGGEVRIFCRVKKMSCRERQKRMISPSLKNTITFPKTDDIVSLTQLKSHANAAHQNLSQTPLFSFQVTVLAVRPRAAHGASTALLIVRAA